MGGRARPHKLPKILAMLCCCCEWRKCRPGPFREAFAAPRRLPRALAPPGGAGDGEAQDSVIAEKGVT